MKHNTLLHEIESQDGKMNLTEDKTGRRAQPLKLKKQMKNKKHYLPYYFL
jgi:hypothetical protein